ncbi:MAG: hypothetical protein Kow0074_04700 [Candidatus Zixiibacteriota bacterium]
MMSRQTLFRNTLAVVWIVCGVSGAFQLTTANVEVVRFWDEADLILDLADSRFAEQGGRLGAVSYATRKIGYAFPVGLLVDRYGHIGGVIWNGVWLCVILLMPIPGVRDWRSYALRAGAVLSLPYMMKYVVMINPTLQSMGLWAVFATVFFYWRRRMDRSRSIAVFGSVALGITAVFLVITDFKWLPFIVGSVALLLSIDTPHTLTQQKGVRKSWDVLWRWVVPWGALILLWIPVAMVVVSIVFPPYARMIYAMFFSLPDDVGVLRFGLSDNFLIHLWYLGGLGMVIGGIIGLIVVWRRDRSILRRYAPYWLPAACICLVFSCAMWPRGARMFAPALLLLISGIAAVVAHDGLRKPDRRLRYVGWGVLLVMTISMARSVIDVGRAVATPTGLDSLKSHILAHTVGPLGGAPELEPLYDPPVLGGYMLPLMIVRASRNGDIQWYSPTKGLRENSNWAILNPAADAFTIEEQAMGGIVAPEWKQDQYFMRESMERYGVTTDTIPAPFYTTPYYTCELTLEGQQLIRAIASHPVSEWRTVYIGTFFQRPYPGEGTSEIAP